MSLEEMMQEALALTMDTGLPRLAVLLVGIGCSDAAADVLALQSEILGVLRPGRRRRRKQK